MRETTSEEFLFTDIDEKRLINYILNRLMYHELRYKEHDCRLRCRIKGGFSLL